ncbi:MAG TPA: mannonate dehydratase [Bryobacteraceae bacterium]|nr:mannonate dehydratase [Bryobacteraceae bacterium]
MNRRQFVTSGATAAALSAVPPQGANAAPAKRALMKLGCQSEPSTEKHFQFLARYGVHNVCGYPEVEPGHLYATVDELKQLRELGERNQISIDCIAPPFLASSHIDREKHPAIMLAQSPERDRDIESLQTLIRNCAAAGIPSIKYNMSMLGVLRTGRVPGRGDCTYSLWSLKKAHPDPPLTRAGHVDADAAWERISYFLSHIMPVAEEYKIRMACHPHDPGVPPEGYQGVVRVLGTVDGLKKFLSIKESPYHGLNFCQGTVSEMLNDPGKEIYDVIRYFGSRNKIFNVHFRNIRGHRNEFVEVYPDEGDVDFVKAIQVYKDVGYSYMMMPDHVPQAPDDPRGLQSFAFCYGYIRALIQAVERMA